MIDIVPETGQWIESKDGIDPGLVTSVACADGTVCVE